jgi:hypothetical protein
MSALACLAHAATAQKAASAGPSRDTLRSYRRSDTFYDSVYTKFQRKKFTRLIYPFAFQQPAPPVADPAATQKSETPYLPFSGKVIRRIRISTMPPFERSVYDTNLTTRSSTGKFLNGAHVTTQKYVIRKELLFQPGDTVNPVQFAETERSIRDLSAIDNVNFYIQEISPGSDTVDITVVTKDVWSIWGSLVTATSSSARFAVYDANFLGLNDFLSVTFSVDALRSPVFRVGGIDYSYSNIRGSFINALFSFSLDNNGAQALLVGLDRPFFANEARWAGSLIYVNRIQVDNEDGAPNIHSRYNEEFAWLGVSYPLNALRTNSRFVLAESFTSHLYQERPAVTAASNPLYFNYFDFLTGFCFYRNDYYTAYYVAQFGRPENIPYGRNIQLTVGPNLSEFTTRMYTAVTFTAGDLIGRAGYLSGQITLGGFLGHNSFEDGITKVSLDYFTPLFPTPNQRYKFRSYLDARYGYGFNLNLHRNDEINLNRLFHLPSLKSDSALEGQHCLGVKASTMMFTPWHFYGFMFALSAFAETGFVADSHTPVTKGIFYGGLGVGIRIKNDNLVFPPFLISFAFYPGNQPGVNLFQPDLSSDPWVRIPTFTARAPRIETLNN